MHEVFSLFDYNSGVCYNVTLQGNLLVRTSSVKFDYAHRLVYEYKICLWQRLHRYRAIVRWVLGHLSTSQINSIFFFFSQFFLLIFFFSSCCFYYYSCFLPSSSKALVMEVKVGFFRPGMFFSISAFDSE